MILRIRQIKKYRCFREWTCPSDLPSFAQVNLIYGPNGSGKSTLAALLHNASSDVDWDSGLELEVLASGEMSARRVNQATDAIWSDVKVFGRDYIATNLRFEDDGGGSAEPLLVLGEQNVKAVDERKKLELRLKEIDARLPALQKKLDNAVKRRGGLLTKQARVIATELGDVGGRYAQRSYNAGTLRKALEALQPGEKISDADVAKDLAVTKEQPLPEHQLPQIRRLSLELSVARTQAAVQTTATSHALQSLLDHPEWQSWVEEGLELHKGEDRCIYCQQVITPERQHDLDAHFDESLRALQKDLDEIEQELISTRSECHAEFTGLPKPAELFQSLRKEYVSEVTNLRKAKDAFDQEVELLLKAIKAKRGALFAAQQLSTKIESRAVSFVEVSELLNKHNKLSASLDTQRHVAARRVERARMAEVREEFETLGEQIDSIETETSELTKEHASAGRALGALTQEELDPQPLADRLNTDVSQLLGHDSLRFVVKGRGYGIERNGVAAEHLSESERNAISLLYFLRSLNTYNSDASKTIVVIDDPVSSLDGNTLAGASAHLWSELVGKSNCRELFVLTHNYELFRTWLGQLDWMRRYNETTAEAYEMRIAVRRLRSGEVVRCPVLVAWPADQNLRNRLRSEYHYLFWRVASELILCKTAPSPERDLEAATVLPNACRRLLEAFLGFKAPAQVGNLHDQIMETGGNSVSKPVRTRMLRFLHAYSHNEEADVSKPAGRPEAVRMLGVVMEFMRAIDSEHVDEMCKAVDIDPSDLDGVVADEDVSGTDVV